MPNVKGGSLFASLQSISMAWDGPAVFLGLAAIGTVADAFFLQTICGSVDSLPPKYQPMRTASGWRRAAKPNAPDCWPPLPRISSPRRLGADPACSRWPPPPWSCSSATRRRASPGSRTSSSLARPARPLGCPGAWRTVAEVRPGMGLRNARSARVRRQMERRRPLALPSHRILPKFTSHRILPKFCPRTAFYPTTPQPVQPPAPRGS